MSQAKFITAMGTPLSEEEELHEEGLVIELAEPIMQNLISEDPAMTD